MGSIFSFRYCIPAHLLPDRSGRGEGVDAGAVGGSAGRGGVLVQGGVQQTPELGHQLAGRGSQPGVHAAAEEDRPQQVGRAGGAQQGEAEVLQPKVLRGTVCIADYRGDGSTCVRGRRSGSASTRAITSHITIPKLKMSARWSYHSPCTRYHIVIHSDLSINASYLG